MKVDSRTATRKIDQLLSRKTLTEEGREYLEYHKERIAFNVKKISDILREKDADGGIRLMDVGPHFQTKLIHDTLGNELIINTLGWFDECLLSRDEISEHYPLDLNDVGDESSWPDVESHDILVMAEVVEHLYTSPSVVFEFLDHLMKSDGHIIVQTPNAVDATKRAKMLFGENPFELIREDRSNPGHFREYTADELRGYAEGVGWEVEEILYCDYWPQRGVRRVLERVIPSFRRGITMVARKS